MFTDALGNDHYEFWEGVKINGKTHQSRPLYALCMEFGTSRVQDACMHLGCLPYVQDLSAIRAECQRQENSYV